MRSKRKWRLIWALMLMMAVLLAGCQSEDKTTKEKEPDPKKTEVKEEEVSAEAKAVIEAMMTGPNSDLLFMPSAVGEGVDTTQAQENAGETAGENASVMENWEDKIGDYFTENGMQDFLTSGPAMKFLLMAEEEGTELQVKEITLEDRSEYTETVHVRYMQGGREEEAGFTFTRDSDGKITQVTEDEKLAATQMRIYEPREISREDFLSAYAKQESVPVEEAPAEVENQRKFLLAYYGIKAEDCNIVYEERTKDKNVGDDLILTATIYTEMLVDKESGEYVSYGVPASTETQLRGDIEILRGEDNLTSSAWMIQNGAVEVNVNDTVYFQTDAAREFTKKDIEKTAENSYQYTINDTIVFTYPL